MNGHGKSDRPILPTKSSNKATQAAETMEGSDLTKGNQRQQNTQRTQSRAGVQSALERIREAARRDRKRQFTCIYHHICNIGSLREAFYALKRDASPGVDGET